jgi:hypothetical protein
MAAYKWTEANVVAAWRNTIGDPSTGPATRWTDAEGSEYLNRAGQQLVLSIPEVFETVWTVPMVDGQREYTMDPAFVAEKHVEYKFSDADDSDIRPLQYLTPEEFRELGFERDETQEGAPNFYTFWRKLGSTSTAEQKPYMILHPTPGSDEDTKLIRTYGYKLPDEINSSPSADNVVETEAHLVEAQVMWAAHLAMRDDDEIVKARDFAMEYERQILKIKDWRYSKTRSQRPRIRPWRGSVFTNDGSPLQPLTWRRSWFRGR